MYWADYIKEHTHICLYAIKINKIIMRQWIGKRVGRYLLSGLERGEGKINVIFYNLSNKKEWRYNKDSLQSKYGEKSLQNTLHARNMKSRLSEKSMTIHDWNMYKEPKSLVKGYYLSSWNTVALYCFQIVMLGL